MTRQEPLCLRVWFYDPRSDPHGVVNKVVAALDGPFCHCEVQFPDAVAFSVYMGSRVVCKARGFDPARYTCVRVPCSRNDLSAARQCAEERMRVPQTFSLLQMMCALAPGAWQTTASADGTFCSKLVAEVLVKAHALPSDTNTQGVTPSGLYRLMHTRFVEGKGAAI